MKKFKKTLVYKKLNLNLVVIKNMLLKNKKLNKKEFTNKKIIKNICEKKMDYYKWT